MKILKLSMFFIVAVSLLLIAALSPEKADINDAPAFVDLPAFLNSVIVGEGMTHKNLTVFPVFEGRAGETVAYVTLDEAIENGRVKITEIDSGNVPTLRLETLSAEPMFFMAGEVITGAKQDRILRSDLLFRGKKGSFEIPVYCVEQGRWTVVSNQFSAGNSLGTKNVRQSAVMKEGQSAVWDEVSVQNESLDAKTETSTFQANYRSEKFKRDSGGYLDALMDLPLKYDGKMIGVVVAIGGRIVSADIFVSPYLCKKLWPKVLKASVMDAISATDGALSDNTPARVFLGTALTGVLTEQKNPSLGNEYMIQSEEVQGNFITSENGVVHLALFTKEKDRPRREPILQRQQNQQQYQR